MSAPFGGPARQKWPQDQRADRGEERDAIGCLKSLDAFRASKLESR